jgi:MYXO-CTERM domain-containing protein
VSVRGSSLALLIAGCVTLLSGGRAQAFVRSITLDSGVPLFWVTPQATLEVTQPPESFPITPDAFHAAVEAAARTWSYPAVPCTAVALDVAAGFGDSDVVAADGHNRIITRTGAWCRDPVDMTKCYDSSQVAITTVFSRSHPGALDDGQILEADVELNDTGYQWAVIPDGDFSGRDYANAYDLRSALTHELGHFLGLAHDCVMPGDPIRVDDSGHVSPDCSDLPSDEAATLLASTMYAVMEPADIQWRSLSPDDGRAACWLYSRTSLPVAGWCAVASSPDQAPSPVDVLIGTGALFAAALAVRSRRSRRARTGAVAR